MRRSVAVRPVVDDLLRVAVMARLARYGGLSGCPRESDLRVFLRWCADRALDPLVAQRVDVELFVRWLREVRRVKPSTVSRAVVGGDLLLPHRRHRCDPRSAPPTSTTSARTTATGSCPWSARPPRSSSSHCHPRSAARSTARSAMPSATGPAGRSCSTRPGYGWTATAPPAGSNVSPERPACYILAAFMTSGTRQPDLRAERSVPPS